MPLCNSVDRIDVPSKHAASFPSIFPFKDSALRKVPLWALSMHSSVMSDIDRLFKGFLDKDRYRGFAVDNTSLVSFNVSDVSATFKSNFFDAPLLAVLICFFLMDIGNFVAVHITLFFE